MNTFFDDSEAFVAIGDKIPVENCTYSCFVLNTTHDMPVEFIKFTTSIIKNITMQRNGIFRILTDTCTIFLILSSSVVNTEFKIVKVSALPNTFTNIKIPCSLLTDIAFINDTPFLQWKEHTIEYPISFVPYSKNFCIILTNNMLYYGIIEQDQ